MIHFDTDERKMSVNGNLSEIVLEAGFLITEIDKETDKAGGSDHIFLKMLLDLLQEVYHAGT